MFVALFANGMMLFMAFKLAFGLSLGFTVVVGSLIGLLFLAPTD